MSELLLARAGFGECRDSILLNEFIRLLVLRDEGLVATQFEGAEKLVRALRANGRLDVESRFESSLKPAAGMSMTNGLPIPTIDTTSRRIFGSFTRMDLGVP